MVLSEISSWISQAVRFKLHPEQVRLLMDMAQKMAFDHNSQAFLVWDETLTPKYYLEFKSTGYTSAVAGDVGKTVVGGTSGATGVLVSYDNTLRKWLLTTSSTFTDGEAITITTGTGAGTLLATASQTGYLGPYDAPTDPPVRKIWGVTNETDARIFGVDDGTDFPMEDFDFAPRLFNPVNFFKPGREDNIAKTFTFAQAPSLPSSNVTYRWVYWRDAPDIDDFDSEAVLLIPARYHLNYVNACVKLAQINLSGEDVDPGAIRAFFQPWWDTLARPYTPMGTATNQTLSLRGIPDSLI